MRRGILDWRIARLIDLRGSEPLVTELGLPPRRREILLQAGYVTAKDLRHASDAELCSLRGFGARSLYLVRELVGRVDG